MHASHTTPSLSAMQTLDKHSQLEPVPSPRVDGNTDVEAQKDEQRLPEKAEDTASSPPKDVLLGLAGVRRIEAIRAELGKLLPLIFVFALIAAFCGQLSGCGADEGCSTKRG
jgi:hypothetical protein